MLIKKVQGYLAPKLPQLHCKGASGEWLLKRSAGRLAQRFSGFQNKVVVATTHFREESQNDFLEEVFLVFRNTMCNP